MLAQSVADNLVCLHLESQNADYGEVSVTLNDLAQELPNGFHDTEFRTIAIDYEMRRVTIDVSVWVATESSARELYRDGVLTIEGLQFLSIEPPDPRYRFAEGRPVDVDLAEGPSETRPPVMSSIPADCFSAGFFVRDWNGFIYVAAREASLEWKGSAYDRS